jgi:hypothetical protein
MLGLFYLASVAGIILILWFRTEVYIEYCRLFGLNIISNYKDYEEKRKNDASLNYIKYLRQYHNNFFIRLITCPICVSIWISIIMTIIVGHGVAFPISFFGGLILFGVINKLLG